MTIGEKIKQAREKKGLSQTELAEKLGYKSRSSVNKIETGGRDIPRSQIVKIAKILDIPPSSLVNIYDDDYEEKHIEYADEETKEFIDSLRKRPEMKLLFKASQNATKEDIEVTVVI